MTSKKNIAECFILLTWLITTFTAFAYYSPQNGRWLSRDPAGERGSVNLYGFVHNGPINTCDLLGLRPLFYSLEVDPRDADDPQHVAFYADAVLLPVVYPRNGVKCACRGRLLGVAAGAAWIDLSTSLGLNDIQSAYYRGVISTWPHWDAANKRIFENPRYVGAGFTANWDAAPGGARACCRNLVWYNSIVRRGMGDKPDGRFAGSQFLDSPGQLRPPINRISNTYRLVLKCEDPGWPVEELGTWYWGLDVSFTANVSRGTFYPPVSDVAVPWPF